MIDLDSYKKACGKFYTVMHRGRGGVYIGENTLMGANIFGQKILADASDMSTLRTLFLATPSEVSIVAFITQFIKAGMVCAEVNAGTGYFSIMMSTLVGPQGKIYSFEGIPEKQALLEKNLKLNDIYNVNSINQFIGEDNQIVQKSYFDSFCPFFFSQQTPQPAKQTSSESISLDSYLEAVEEPLLDFILIHEVNHLPAIWKGMSSTLISNPNLVVICFFDRDHQISSGHDPLQFLETLDHQQVFLLPKLNRVTKQEILEGKSKKTIIITRK